MHIIHAEPIKMERGIHMFTIDLKNRTPIYEQVISGFKSLVMSGVLNESDKVPSVRDMAKELGVNPNTVQKAYRELESQGYFYTVLGQGNFISAAPDSARHEIDALYAKILPMINELIFRGEDVANICEFVQQAGRKKHDNG